MNDEQQSVVRDLTKEYHQRGIALGLGAGLSMGCGLPSWRELLVRIAKQQYPDGEALVLGLIAQGHSLGMIAGMLESRIKKERFGEAVRDALYAGFQFYRQKYAADTLRTFVRQKNPTLASVAAFCASVGPVGFTANPRVAAIANMNFDAILTRYVKARYGRLLRTIERPSASRVLTRIPVYHVHGFFEFDEGSIGDREAEAPDIRVLTEQDFFDFFNAPNAVFSYTFLYLLREYAMLFIGMSLQDDNIRRLLHYSAQERYQSVLREGRGEEKAQRKMLRHFSFQQRTNDAIDTAVSDALRRLGVQPIWYEQHAEIPQLLGSVYGKGWSGVYEQVGP